MNSSTWKERFCWRI